MIANIKNRTLFFNDNLRILKGINSESIDLIYLDPPFNKKKVFTMPADGASVGFRDIFRVEDVDENWLFSIKEDEPQLSKFLTGIQNIEGWMSYNFCYLAYMAIRLVEIRRVLKDTASIYLHCDPTMSQYLKFLMDYIFGTHNFLADISWKRYAAHNVSNRSVDTISDHLLYYAKDSSKVFNRPVTTEVSEEELNKKFPHVEEETGRRFQHVALEQSSNKSSAGEVRMICGKKVVSMMGWRWSQRTFDERLKKNPLLIYWTKTGKPRYKKYLDEYAGAPVGNIWTDISYLSSRSSERTGYPTQKPLALLERIIKASSNEGDMVLDPFCGCATTCVAAEMFGRKWSGIDKSVKAFALAKKRLLNEVNGEIHYAQEPPVALTDVM